MNSILWILDQNYTSCRMKVIHKTTLGNLLDSTITKVTDQQLGEVNKDWEQEKEMARLCQLLRGEDLRV